MSHYYTSMEEHQFLSPQYAAPSSSHTTSWPSDSRSHPTGTAPSLDLQLSISVTPLNKPPLMNSDTSCVLIRKVRNYNKDTSSNCVETLKWQAAEHIRLAAIERAYAERVRETARREMECAQSEFARARSMWERARDEMDRAEKMKERAAKEMGSTCMEITCHSCRQKFRP